MYDIIIIGAGAIGSFIARSSSKYNLRVLVLEKESDVGNITSNANSAIVHSGYDPEPGTNKAKFNVLGNKMFPQVCDELDVHFVKNGSLTVAKNEVEFETLQSLKDRALLNGVEVEILNKEETLKIEPNLNKNIAGSLFAPSAGIVDPFNLVIHAMENAVDNGVTLHLNEEVLSVKKVKGRFVVKTRIRTYESLILINAAGLNSDSLIKLKGKDEFKITPRKGEYFLLDHFDNNFLKHTIFPLPSKKGKGILVSPTCSNNYIVGPSSEEVFSKDDFDTDSATLNQIKLNAIEMVDNIPFNETIKVFAGLRATCNLHDFVIKESENIPGLIICGGIESPGLVSSPAIGEYVVNELVGKILPLVKNESYNPRVRKYIRLSELNSDERSKLINENHDFAITICNCENISLGEIKDVFSRSVPPHTVKGVKKRTRAGFGKCQGGYCQNSVISIIAEQYGIKFSDVNYDKTDSNIFFGKLREGK